MPKKIVHAAAKKDVLVPVDGDTFDIPGDLERTATGILDNLSTVGADLSSITLKASIWGAMLGHLTIQTGYTPSDTAGKVNIIGENGMKVRFGTGAIGYNTTANCFALSHGLGSIAADGHIIFPITVVSGKLRVVSEAATAAPAGAVYFDAYEMDFASKTWTKLGGSGHTFPACWVVWAN
jgi:hypothetical protein